MAKCHWPKSMTHGHKPDVHNKTVIDQSMTVWLWTSGLWPCVIDFGQWHLAISEPWKIVKKSVIDWMYTIQAKKLSSTSTVFDDWYVQQPNQWLWTPLCRRVLHWSCLTLQSHCIAFYFALCRFLVNILSWWWIAIWKSTASWSWRWAHMLLSDQYKERKVGISKN